MHTSLRHFASLLFCCLILVSFQEMSLADQVHMKNGDRVTGKIVKETDLAVTIKSDMFGEVIINKDLVEKIEKQSIPKPIKLAENKKTEKSKIWSKEISLGFTQSGGNTEKMSGSSQISLNRKTFDDEWILKASSYYGSSDGELTDRKYSGIIRYAFSFGQRRWYNFYKLEGNRDRFANISHRLIPSTGVGYWLADTPDFKAMAEGAIGLEHTNFRDSTETSNEAVLVPRGFLEKKLWDHLILAEDITLYPSLTDAGTYRFISQTDLTSPIKENLSLRLSFVDEYNSNPPGKTKKNDFRITSSLVYSF